MRNFNMLKLPNILFKNVPLSERYKTPGLKTKLCKVPETLTTWGGKCRCAALPLFYSLLETTQSKEKHFFL